MDRSYANSAVSSSTEAPSSAISSNGEDTRLSTRGKQRKHLKMITELILQKKKNMGSEDDCCVFVQVCKPVFLHVH